jgi:ribosomal protein S27AE
MPMTDAERNQKYYEAHKDRINEARRLVRKVPRPLPRECPHCGKTCIYFAAHMRKKHPDL